MNVYDFDGTICYPDSSINFAIYCMNHHPHLWLTFFPKAIRNLIRYKRGKMTRARMMLEFFSILRIKDFDRLIERYRDTHEKNISEWYLAQKKPEDRYGLECSHLTAQIYRHFYIRRLLKQHELRTGKNNQ